MVKTIQDTPDELVRLQRDIMLSKMPHERAAMGIDMIESAYHVARNSLLNKNPGISEGELIALIFERYYANDFSVPKISEIKRAIISYHNEMNKKEIFTSL